MWLIIGYPCARDLIKVDRLEFYNIYSPPAYNAVVDWDTCRLTNLTIAMQASRIPDLIDTVRVCQPRVGEPRTASTLLYRTDLKIDWIWHLLPKIEAGVYRSHFTIF